MWNTVKVIIILLINGKRIYQQTQNKNILVDVYQLSRPREYKRVILNKDKSQKYEHATTENFIESENIVGSHRTKNVSTIKYINMKLKIKESLKQFNE